MTAGARHEPSPEAARYRRQMRFEPIGPSGQRQLRHSFISIVGCGALGSVLAETLVRAGVEAVRIIDRDFLEIDNLQRQVLFDEHDIAANLPKAEAAARKLRRINSAAEIEPVVADLCPANAEKLLADADLILDGTDNLETRYLVNDVAVAHKLPWVYGGCVAAEGRVLAVLPGRSACLRCVWPEPPAPGTLPTCDTAGVLGPAVNMVASLQALTALKLLTGHEAGVGGRLHALDVWTGRWVQITTLREADCPCCVQGVFAFLRGTRGATTTTLCGREAVQITPEPRADGGKLDFRTIVRGLPDRSHPRQNEFMLRFTLEHLQITLFPDGRAIVQGTNDPAVARGAYAKYVGM